jgi:hypothetical protein
MTIASSIQGQAGINIGVERYPDPVADCTPRRVIGA